MSGLSDFGKIFKQKKSKRLFWGMLGPLLIVTFSACTFFYYVCLVNLPMSFFGEIWYNNTVKI